MTELFEHPYASFLEKVIKPNRYTGAEHNVVRKDWSSVQAKVCLAFPDIYDIGMSHLGYRILYKLLNDDPRLLAERCYTPWLDMQEQLIAHGLLLGSLESVRPLCDFDVVGFSLQYELTYTNILTMLQLGGIPLRSAARGDDDPLVVAGGPVATHAEPIAPFIDAFLIGDGEEAAAEIALCWTEAKAEGLGREERLVRLSRITGVYVPSLYDVAPDPDSGLHVVQPPTRPDVPFPIERRLVKQLDDFPFPDDAPVGGPEAIFDRMSIEVARGCTEGCRFCQAGMIYRPVRERDPEQVVDTVLRAIEKSGQDEVSLTALSTADVSCISPLIKRLVEKTAPERVSLSVASLRAYGLAEDLLDDMRRVRASGLTFAPEAGTQRMRDVINKNVTEEQLLQTAERVFSRGFDKMKLYFILGLPTEMDEDVLGIADVGLSALAVGKRVGKRPQVTVSVSTHVPKPHTPFQWCAMDPLSEVRRKQQLLRDACRGKRGLQLRVHDSTTSVLEGVLARGDRRLADVIERAFLRGARFDSWEDQVRIELWEEALAHWGIATEPFLGTLPLSARLPWDHIDVGLEDGFLAREYQKALKSRLSPPCGKARGMFVHHTNVAQASSDSRRLVCYDCGVACDLGKMRTDRIGLLEKMGAHEPGQRARLPLIDDAPERPTHLHEHHPERFRPVRAGSPPRRWRLAYTKTGPTALLGHLDFIRELPRVIRRAGVRTAYTEGFRPKPDMSFGPALALGLASLDEYLDIKLIDAPPAEELLARLNAATVRGLEFTGAALLGPNDPGLSKLIRSAVYVVGLDSTAVARLGGRSRLEQLMAEFFERPEALVRRDVKGIGRQIDVRAGVTELALGDERAEAVLRRAGVVGRLTPLVMTVPMGGQGAVRIAEVLEAVFGDRELPHVGVRSALRGAEGSLLDLAAHRKPQERVSQAILGGT
ncbi:MAG: TIGR03960 family B12-binding radical SAM protein [Myxococcales bacterium]|nr:TIGR03960 family B12-binding radical SAM protein [Myxococcales bacterium]